MKKITQLLTALVFCSLMIFISCGSDDGGGGSETDPRDVAAANLTKTWSVESATFNSTARDEWADFTIGFAYNTETDEGSYTTSGVPTDDGADAVWGSNITWTYTSETTPSAFLRSDGITVQSTLNADNTQLTLSFTVPEAGSRVAGFTGQWVFVLNAN